MITNPILPEIGKEGERQDALQDEGLFFFSDSLSSFIKYK